MQTEAAIRLRLEEAGLRATRQRVDLAQLMFASGDRHFTAEMLHGEALVQGDRPSLATVYNTLKQFCEAGLVQEIAVYGTRTWFDTKVGAHCHYYLEDEEMLVDVPDALAPLLSIPGPDGTVVTAVDVVIRLRRRPAA
jgi:Fur family iron response transcriptional regulator